jgi:hypothetical protein
MENKIKPTIDNSRITRPLTESEFEITVTDGASSYTTTLTALSDDPHLQIALINKYAIEKSQSSESQKGDK